MVSLEVVVTLCGVIWPTEDAAMHSPPTLSTETIRQLRPRLHAFARRALRDDDDAEDLAQDTLLAMLRAPTPFRGDASLPTFATAILKHKIADLARARASERRTRASALADAACAADTAPDPLTALAHVRVREQVWPLLRRELKALPALMREAFVLRVLQDVDTQETSRRLRISANYTAALTVRAKQRLRRGLDAALRPN